MSISTHPFPHAALVLVTAGAFLLAIAHAEAAGNTSVAHKRHFYRAPILGHWSGPAEAWMSGRCDRPLQSEFPPCIFPGGF
jgi:hypothetical protein